MSNVNSDLNRIARQIEGLIKNEITKKKLVDTGKLLNSINVKFKKTNTGYIYTIEAMDYFPYLDKEYHIIKDAFSSSEFSKVQDGLADIFINEMLDGLN